MNRKRSYRRRQKPPFGERAKDHCRKFTAFMFSNVGIILLVILYMIAGAFIFRAIEINSGSKKFLKDILDSERRLLLPKLWNYTLKVNIFQKKIYKQMVHKEILSYQHKIVKAHFSGADVGDLWSFSGAFLYSLTVITTIGYGNISPRTNWGKVCTIIYAIIGMPLFLLYLSNIGDILAKSFKWIYAKICLCRVCPGVARRRALREKRRIRAMTLERDMNNFPEDGSDASYSVDSDGIPYGRPSRYSQRRQDSISDFGDRGGGADDDDADDEDDDMDIDDELQGDIQSVNVPVTICVVIMIGYILFGATLFGKWENWDLLDGSYFCFISLSSIGFGDIVPGDKVVTSSGDNIELSFILCAIYLLLGMALIAMCFNLMQERTSCCPTQQENDENQKEKETTRFNERKKKGK